MNCDYRGLPGLDVGTERALLEPVKQVAFLDLGAFLEQHLVDEGRNPGDHVDPLGGHDAAGIFGRFGNRLALGRRDTDRRRRPAGHLRPDR